MKVNVTKKFTLTRTGGERVHYEVGVQDLPDSDLHYHWTKHHIETAILINNTEPSLVELDIDDESIESINDSEPKKRGRKPKVVGE